MSRNQKNIKCPKCKNSPDLYKEFSYQVQEFAVDDDGIIDESGEINPDEVLFVIACCGSCSHEWKLRGIRQISKIRSK